MLRDFGLNEVWFLVLAARWTLALSAVAFVGGGVVGLLLAVARISPWRWLRVAVSGWIQVVQATPMLMLLLLFYFGINMFGVRIDAWTAAAVAFTIGTSAYLADIWRGCIQAVPQGQWEAAKALALNFRLTLALIVIPQAVRMALPPTVGYMVQVVKGTSLAALIGFTELAKAGAQMNTITFEPVRVFGTVSLLYFAMCFPLSMLARRLERKLHVGSLRVQAL
ncbi:amino acid ABC transporter permease [Alsobacter sp. SYSU M60028]|uniref:Amino acid ABC transporter permease n=1 Tax=Alsobacter ponti TaxID=2962936 RepID=A0ABT1LEX9_9HYPH|nr:amino acid ABC transporter permease [Alsobacter ponti]MCP8940034.1 amino acid ABC transporter permease [Alsobacter ponti]